MNRHHPSPRSSQAGFALPLALVGLVVVTLLVTTAILTSSTELALSNAHRDAARGLFEADAALEGFIGETAILASNAPTFQVPIGDQTYDREAQGAISAGCAAATQRNGAFCVSTARLYFEETTGTGNGQITRREIWSLIARPHNARGWGRRVGVLIESLRMADAIATNIQAGASFSGSQVNITGASLVSGIQDTTLCAGADTAHAVTMTAGTELDYRDRNIEGAIDTVHVEEDGESFDQMVFGGLTIAELQEYSTVRYGVGQPLGAWPNHRVNSLDSGNEPRATTDPRNWGCPGQMDDRTSCHANGGDTTHFPIVVIDACNHQVPIGGECNDPGTVSINGDHGQGWLIVTNGNLNIQGNFTYRGVIAVQGSLDIRGTGSGDSKIEGAVVATGEVRLERGDGSSDISGRAVIRYNTCAIASAEEALNQQALNAATLTFTRRPYGWFETFR